MRPDDRQAQTLRQCKSGSGVIEMSVRQQDLRDIDTFGVDLRHDEVEIAAGIDHRGVACDFAPDERTILPKGRDWNDADAHAGNVAESLRWRKTAARTQRYFSKTS